MGFELEKRLASELTRLTDEASHDRDVQRSNKHVERLKQIAAELQAKLAGADLGQAQPGKRTAVDDIVGNAVRKLEQIGRRGFSATPWQQAHPFDHFRATGLGEVLGALKNTKLRNATLAAAEPAIAQRTGAPATKNKPTADGQAMWRVAERRAATLYRNAMDSGEVASEDPIVDEALAKAGSGNALPLAVRKQMEAELGMSLARVRVHTDPIAQQAAKAVRAQAFTVGEDIFFAEGMYAPDSREGKKLLAHELTHVVQAYQGRTAIGGEGVTVSQPGESLEREADAVADRVDTRAQRAPRPQAKREEAKMVWRARGSSPQLPAPTPSPTKAKASAPVVESAKSAAGRVLMRKPATSAADAQGPQGRTNDPNKRGTIPKVKLERDKPKEKSTFDAKKGAPTPKGKGEEISKQVKSTTKAAVDGLKTTAKQVQQKGVGKQAKALASQQKKAGKLHQAEAKKAAKQATQGGKAKVNSAVKKAAGGKNGPDGQVGAIKFKKISDWKKYAPEDMKDTDPREQKRIMGLVKGKVNGEREQSARLLNQLHKAQMSAAKQVQGMLPGLTGQIRGGQNAAIGKVNAAESSNIAAVRSHVAGVTGQVRAAAASSIGQINAAFTAAMNTIRDAKQDATQKLTDAKTQSLSDIDAAEQAQVAAVNLSFDNTRNAIIGEGTRIAGIASGRGDTYPLDYDGDKLEAARKAAREVAAEYAKAMPEEARKAYDQVNAERPKTIADIRKMAVDQRKQVNDAFKQCKQTVDDAAEQAIKGATEMKTAAVQQVTQTQTTTVSQLTALGTQVQAGIRQQASGARSGIQKAGATAIQGVTKAVNDAANGLRKGATGLAKGAKQVEAPNVEETKQRVTEGMQQLGESQSSMAAGFKKNAESAVSGMSQQAQGAATGISQAATQGKQSATQMGSGATQSMSQIAQGSSQGLQQLGQNFQKSATEIAGKGKEAMDGVVKGLQDAYKAAGTQLDEGLKGAVDNVKSSFAEAVLPQEDAAIAENAKKAADAVKPWWQKALAFVVSIVVAIVVVVVVTALIVTTGPIGAILVGAAAGALGSVLGQMASNLVLGNGLMDGITWQTVAMGAVGGAVGAGFTQAVTAGARQFGVTAVSSALKGGTGAGAFAIRTGVGVTGDLVSDAATQLIFTGGYEFSMQNLATSLVTNAVTSTNRYDTAQESFQNGIRNHTGHIEIGRPGGGGLNLSTSAHGPGSPVTNQPVDVAPGGGGGGNRGGDTGPSTNTGGPRPQGGDQTARPQGGDQTARPQGGDQSTRPQGDTTTRPQGDTTTRPQGDTTTRPQGDQTTRPQGDQTTRPQGDQTTRPQGDQTTRPQGDQTTRPQGDQTTRPQGDDTTTRPQGDQTTRPQGDQTTRPQDGQDGQRTQGADRDGDGRPDRQPTQDRDRQPTQDRDGDGRPDTQPGPRQDGDNTPDNTPDSTPDSTPDAGDGPQSASADALNDLGYPNPTRVKADQAADAIESGTRPPADTIRDTDANRQGLRELDTMNADPTLTPESKANIRRTVAEGLRAEEPSGNLARDVQQAKAQEQARVQAEQQQQQQQNATQDVTQDTTPGQTPDQTPGSLGDNSGPGIKPGTERTTRGQIDQDAFEVLPAYRKTEIAGSEIANGTRVFDSQEAAGRWGSENLNAGVDRLPADQRQSIRNYTLEPDTAAHQQAVRDQGGDVATYREMNGVLRADAKGQASKYDAQNVRDDIARVDQAMAANPLPEAVTVVRGTGHGHLDATHPADLVGTVMGEPGYLSTSLGDNGAVPAFADKDMILHLRVPAGQEALWVENASAFGGGERELLLGRGTQWEVTRAFIGDDGKWHVYGIIQ